MAMTEQQVRERVRELAPFHHVVDLPYGLSTYVPELAHRDLERTRVANLVRHAWPALMEACGGSLAGMRVLDVACNCGGFSVEAVKSGADQVLGVDVVDRYLEQAEFIKQALGCTNLEFRKMTIEDLSRDNVGRFDVALCFGILYHLEDPVRAMKGLASVTRRVMVVDTDVVRLGGVLPFVRSEPLWLMSVVQPGGSEEETTNLWRQGASCQFRPTAQAVEKLLWFLGFGEVRRLKPTEKGLERRYYKGTRATFIAVR